MYLPCRDFKVNFVLQARNFLIFIVFISALAARVDAADPGSSANSCTTIEIYTATGCPHCQHALEFLKQLRKDNPDLVVHNHNVRTDPEDMQQFIEINRRIGEEHPGVPTFQICDQIFIGFDTEETTGATIKRLLNLQQPYAQTADLSVDIPLFGKVSVAAVGMPLFTLVIGLVDGFNPCAMWVLLVLLTLLVNLRDRKRLSLIAGTFVFISGAIYFAFMAAWLNLFLIIGATRAIQIGVGLIALVIGAVHIKDYFAFKQGVSLSIPDRAKPGLYQKMRNVVYAENLLAALAAVAILAVLVNLVELACTVGLPALYTQILATRAPEPLRYYGYLLLYNLAYIFDDTVMVTIAVFTLSSRRLQQREGRWLKLLSGGVIFLVGALLIAAPRLLI